jgi:RNA polymerase sigma-70 factor (ECF subfamily)
MKSREKNCHEIMVEDQRRNTVREMITKLPDEQREVLIMRIYAELSFKEIAEITGVSINTALGRMRYALIHLRGIMEKNGIASYI